jgi:hypothetical protein
MKLSGPQKVEKNLLPLTAIEPRFLSRIEDEEEDEKGICSLCLSDQTRVTKAEHKETKTNKCSQWFGFFERNIPALAFKWLVRSY